MASIKNLLSSYIVFIFLFFSCSEHSNKNKPSNEVTKNKSRSVIKPATIFADTVVIDFKAAVFYYPDSLQLKMIREAIDTSVFDAMVHEYFYQFKYAHDILNKYWANVQVIEARNTRYLLFKKTDGIILIDLDKRYDPYGLFLFDPGQDPTQLELTNAESQIGFYFNDANRQKNINK